MNNGTKLCGIMLSSNIDQDGDAFSLQGLSIEYLKNAIINSEHEKSWTKTIGKIIESKKIYSLEDCKSEQEANLLLKNNKIPFLYGVVELFDNTDHVEAKSVAAIVEYHKSGDKGELPLFFSIEIEPVSVSSGKVYSLSVARRVSLVRTPANRACIVEIYREPTAFKSAKEQVMTKEEVDTKLQEVITNLTTHVQTFQKSLEAGYAMGPVGTSTQGAALQKKEENVHVVHIPDESSDTVHEESTRVIHVPEHMTENDKKKLHNLVKSFIQSAKLVKKV